MADLSRSLQNVYQRRCLSVPDRWVLTLENGCDRAAQMPFLNLAGSSEPFSYHSKNNTFAIEPRIVIFTSSYSSEGNIWT